jgi:type IV pilus assembly protein PilB
MMAVRGMSVALVSKAVYVMLSLHNNNTAHSTECVGLGDYLLRDGLLDAATVELAIHAAEQQGISLSTYLVKSAILSSHVILNYCANLFGLPIFDLKNYDVTWLHESTIKLDIIYRYRVIPLHRDHHSLYLGITDPTDHAAITALSFHLGLRIRPMLVAIDELDKIIELYCRPHILHSQLESTLSKMSPLEEPAYTQEKLEKNDEPVIAFVDKLLHDAIEKHISDIHIEPYEAHCRIRFRRDGLLHEAARLPPHLASRVTTRLKIMANLNIAERRLPQDGRISLKTTHKIDIRINTCPTLFGEKIVLRILDKANSHFDIKALGLNEIQYQLFLNKLSQPQGLILVTGPTGSGKTLTLYSALHYLNQSEKNISSVEDPVEIELNGINQVNVNPKIGLDFPAVLRSFLRQDPDVIMLGEIRDFTTASIATQAAQTGHLVLATLHTNSAAEAMNRLQAMGVETYNLIHSVTMIIAQRLIRLLCAHCKQAEIVSAGFIAYRAVGCEHCYQGYQGRSGIFEIIPITDTLASLLLSNNHISLIIEEAKKGGSILLRDAGLEKVKAGLTSYAELARVVGIKECHPFIS